MGFVTQPNGQWLLCLIIKHTLLAMSSFDKYEGENDVCKTKVDSIAVILAAFMCVGFVGQSRAIEITFVWPGSHDSYAGFYSTHYVSTDKPIYHVSWCINGDLAGSKTFDAVAGPTSTYYDFNQADYPGHLKGQKYEVEVEVWEWDADNEVFRFDTETYTIYVFKPMFTTEVEEPPKLAPNVYGYSELTRQYYTGDAIKIDCSVYAYNPFETRIYAWSRFKHSLTGKHTIERDHPNPNGVEPQRIGGKYGSYSHSDTLSHDDNINLDARSYKSGAYVRLLVESRGTDNYFIDNFVTFDSDDEPYDAPDDELDE